MALIEQILRYEKHNSNLWINTKWLRPGKPSTQLLNLRSLVKQYLRKQNSVQDINLRLGVCFGIIHEACVMYSTLFSNASLALLVSCIFLSKGSPTLVYLWSRKCHIWFLKNALACQLMDLESTLCYTAVVLNCNPLWHPRLVHTNLMTLKSQVS